LRHIFLDSLAASLRKATASHIMTVRQSVRLSL